MKKISLLLTTAVFCVSMNAQRDQGAQGTGLCDAGSPHFYQLKVDSIPAS